MSEFTERLRDYGLTSHDHEIIHDRQVVDEAADIIDELENPSDETINAMDKAISDSDYGALRYEVPDEEILRIFKAMVRSVLERAGS